MKNRIVVFCIHILNIVVVNYFSIYKLCNKLSFKYQAGTINVYKASLAFSYLISAVLHGWGSMNVLLCKLHINAYQLEG